MDAQTIIQQGLERNQNALSEYYSKKLLASYGVPVTREELAQDENQAVEAAKSIGFPVVLKACSPEMMHKSEGGFVLLNISDEEAVRQAYQTIMEKADAPLEGVLVQEMVSGQRELVAGLVRDAQFGPCVMAGLGGVMTEVFKDTAFRMAPIDMVEAKDMVDELKCRPMLDAFRGQAPADLDSMGRCLMALGEIGLAHDGVAEIDVNPLIVDKKGRVKAVDALVVLKGASKDA
jgi:succinyl-CoA synthetase beta subunit